MGIWRLEFSGNIGLKSMHMTFLDLGTDDQLSSDVGECSKHIFGAFLSGS